MTSPLQAYALTLHLRLEELKAQASVVESEIIAVRDLIAAERQANTQKGHTQ